MINSKLKYKKLGKVNLQSRDHSSKENLKIELLETVEINYNSDNIHNILGMTAHF